MTAVDQPSPTDPKGPTMSTTTDTSPNPTVTQMIPRPVFLVVDPHGGGAPLGFVDRARAHELARNTGCLVVELAAQADYSGEES